MLPLFADNLKAPFQRAAEEFMDNPGQWQAYESTGNCVILAGPGSGKTRLLTTKMARMLAQDVKPPRGIACITYNSECAHELKWRLDQLGVHESRNVFIGTIHSFCLKHVVLPYSKVAGMDLPPEMSVASSRDQQMLFEKALGEVMGADEYPPSWRARFDRYRRTHLDRDVRSWEDDKELANLVECYEQHLRENNLIDFDDMVLIGLRLIEGHSWIRRAIKARFPVLAVDEYQDLGLALHRMVVTLVFAAGIRLFAVGDPDQSIYGFAGAQPDLLRELSGMKGIKEISLQFNYRCGKRIVDASEVALGERRGYQSKSAEKGTIDFYECPEGLEEQAALICTTIIPEALQRRPDRHFGDIAVLYLDRNDGDIIAEQASSHGIKLVRIDRGAPYPKTPLIRWLENCASWCAGGWMTGKPRLSELIATWFGFNRDSRSEESRLRQRLLLVRFLSAHRSGRALLRDWLLDFRDACLGETLKRERMLSDEREVFENLLSACREGTQLEDLQVVEFGGQGGSPEHLNLITLHSAKGLEFDVVIMMGMDQGKIPSWSAKSKESKREPRRLFYVGLTRARHEVHMTYSGWVKNRYGTVFENGASEFLLEVRRRAIDKQ